jgi:hypothetical protein
VTHHRVSLYKTSFTDLNRIDVVPVTQKKPLISDSYAIDEIKGVVVLLDLLRTGVKLNVEGSIIAVNTRLTETGFSYRI